MTLSLIALGLSIVAVVFNVALLIRMRRDRRVDRRVHQGDGVEDSW